MPRNHRRLTVETLEHRQLLSATHPTAGMPSPDWFQPGPTQPVQPGVPTAALPPHEWIDWNGQQIEVTRGEWIVQFRSDVTARMRTAADAQDYLQDADFAVSIVRGLGLPGNMLFASSANADQMARWLGSIPEIESFEPNGLLYPDRAPNDPYFACQYSLDNPPIDRGYCEGELGFIADPFLVEDYAADADIDAPEAWEITTGSADVIAAVVDTGVDYRHEDLQDNMWVNPGEIPGNSRDDDGNGFVDDIHGFDFGDYDPDPLDFDDHGTSVAGTIGATGDNGKGGTGVGWHTSIMALKVAQVSGAFNIAGVSQAINYATMMRLRGHNIRVSNHSYGNIFPSTTFQRSIEAHRDADIIFVTSAGNAGEDNDRVDHYPSDFRFDNIIAAAATGPADELAVFSNYGLQSVDLGAPGVQMLLPAPRDTYVLIDGTSFASPITAGVVALVAAHAPTATYVEIRQAVLDGVDPVPSLFGKTATGGRLNAHGALLAIEAIKPSIALLTGNGEEIVSGDNTPSTADNTDFGSVNVANGRKVNAFSLANVGGTPLDIISEPAVIITGPARADYTVTVVPAASVPGGESTQFAITFDPSTAGTRAAVVTLEFGSGEVLNFSIQGSGAAPPPPWQNPRNRFDVNNDNIVTGLDVLVLVNEMNRNGQRPLPPPTAGNAPPPFYDVTGDNNLSALDTLQVINHINTRPQLRQADAASGFADAPSSRPVQPASADDELLYLNTWQQAADSLAAEFGTASSAGRRTARR